MILSVLLAIVLITPLRTPEPNIVVIHHHEWLTLTSQIRSFDPQWAWRLEKMHADWKQTCPTDKHMFVDIDYYKLLVRAAFD